MSLVSAAQRRWAVFSAAPHRMFFATGIAWLLGFSVWWTIVIAARTAGIVGHEPALPGLVVHGAAILFLVLSPFISGFLLTVFPRWMPAPDPGRAPQLAAFALFNLGNLLVLAGTCGSATLFTVGWLVSSAGLAVVFALLVRVLVGATTRISHAWGVLTGLAAALCGMALFARALLTGDFSAWPLVRGLGLWGFLLPVYFSVCHRMIPFFTSRVVRDYVMWRPGWLLAAFVALSLTRALLELAPHWRWAAELPMAAIALTCTLRWWPRERTGEKLLIVLHIAFAWLTISLALGAADGLAAFAGTPGIFGRAPLHALGMGFFGSMLMAMVTRVTLGHAGRPLVFDQVNWRLFQLVQAGAVLRVAADLLPQAGQSLTLAAALAWVGGFATWAVRHGAIYFRPRIDGAPG